ncbi:hypothetical protein EJB05_30845 [Eragrostis curvula]|uniref:Myb-like domain-containing protein n=1 Tax=Eragrostis curvula TaxID=38414 RepID=A0A5J9UDH4_9POAL|nr:hypothetical protein EJB05_30845 [Eragrostis curvula]
MAAAAAAGGSGDGSGNRGGGWPVKPHEQGMLNTKVKKRKKAPMPRDRAQSGSPESAVTTCPAMTPAASSGGHDVDQEVQQPANGKRPRTPAASSGGGGHDVTEVQQQTNGKRPRLVWTTELHEMFVRACRSLDREVVPKKILEAMKVNGLTRENVASHLQKYRQNLQGRGPATRRRGVNGGNGTVTMQHAAAPASLQPAFPQVQPPVAAAFPQAPSPSPTMIPPPTPPQGPFAAPNTPQPQMGHVQFVQALPVPALVHRHQRRPDVPVLMQAPAVPPHQLFYQPPPQFHQAAMQQRHRIIMEHQARHAARMNLQQAAVAPGHGHQMVARNYELGAQTLTARAPAAAASQTVNMSGGSCLVPEPSARHEQTEARVGVAQLQQIAVEAAEGGQVPTVEPAFSGSADPDGGQQEDHCDVLHFWNADSAPSMDHEFPPNKPI